MKKSADEQIIAALKEIEAGAKSSDVYRGLGVTEATLYRWKAKYGGLDVSDARRLKQLPRPSRRPSVLPEPELESFTSTQ